MPLQSNTFSTTRLSPPVLGEEILNRPRLIDLLLRPRERALTLISAPAGYGKTTLLLQWLRIASSPVAWLTLAPEDDHPVTFLSRIIAAIDQVFPGAADPLRQMLEARVTPNVLQLTTMFTNALAELPKSFILVLEDYHQIQDQGVHELVVQLLASRLRKLHLVITTRSEPPIPVNSLRGYGQVVEVRQRDLRFTANEIAALIELAYRVSPSINVVQSLCHGTEGWAVGLRLALASTRSGDELALLSSDLQKTRDHAIAFLADEVIAHLDVDMKHFLIRVSVLDEICAPLCAEMLNLADEMEMAGMIQRVLSNNLFLTPLESGSPRWYRFHSYFRALLQEELVATLSLHEREQLHLRAARWLGAHGYIEHAVRQALAGNHNEYAGELVEEYIPTAIDNLNRWQIRTLLGLLPDEVIENNAGLLLRRGWAHNWSTEMALTPAVRERVAALLKRQSPERRAAYQAELHTYAAQFAWEVNDLQTARKEAESALNFQPKAPAHVRGMAAMTLGKVMYAEGKGKEALDYLEEEQARHGKLFDAFSLRVSLGRYQVLDMQGQIELAAEAASNHLLLGRKGNLRTAIAWGYYVSGVTSLEQWRLDSALQHFSSFEEIAHAAEPRTRLDGLLGQALTYEFQGRFDLADSCLERAMEIATLSGSQSAIDDARSGRIRISLGRGEIEKAFGLLSQPVSTAVQRRLLLSVEVREITTARALIAEGSSRSLAEARALIDSFLAYTRSVRNRRHEVQALLAECLLYLRMNQTSAARDALRVALQCTTSHGAIRPFIEMGKPMLSLLREEARRRDNRVFVRRVLTHLQVHSTQKPKENEWANPLTNRERDILELLAQRYNNNEIAAAMVVSPNTVRTHLVNIFQKLGVENRRQAVAKAREHGLIE